MDRFRCCDCGRTFDEPKEVQESRGEFWGSPCWETMYYCPYCNGDYEENTEGREYWISAYTQSGEQFGATIEAENDDKLFEEFQKQYPDCEIADYGINEPEV